jgi:hypothetical protein
MKAINSEAEGIKHKNYDLDATVGGNAKKTSQYSKKPLNNFRFTLEFEFSFVG